MKKNIIPKVVIVGRTNVGKSTLFNRLIQSQKSLVSAIPGTTRDRYEADCIWRAQVIRVIDTGGLDRKASEEIDIDIARQARAAIKMADLILFIADAQTGIQDEDRELIQELLKTKKPIIAVANKADNSRIRDSLNEKQWHNIPFATVFGISARQGNGVGDLLDEIFIKLKKAKKEPAEIADITSTRISVIGRPNVGKSTLLNAMIGENRYITSSKEHTTRQPNDSLVNIDGRDYTLIDTAGVRKIARVNAGKSKLEQAGVEQTLDLMSRADVVFYVIDVSKKISQQDKFLAGKLAESEASAIIIANKWDLIPDKETNTINEYEEYLQAMLPSLKYAPIVFVSALTGKRVQSLFDLVDEVYKARFTQLSDDETDEFIRKAIVKHKPSRGKGVQHPTITSFTQTGINPPVFTLRIKQTHKEALSISYVRFLKNILRDQHDFEGTPIFIKVVERKKSHTTR